MHFPDSYFEDEVRDGFYVNGMVKKCWGAQLEILSEVDKVCTKHGIKWFADCGTLLGAVRHGGFIPWDDDLDICMLRDDYLKFIKLAGELPGGYEIVTLDSRPDYYEYIIKVVNGNKINLDKDYLEKYCQFPFPAGIDIFPIDYLAPDTDTEEERNRLITILLATRTGLEKGGMSEAEAEHVIKDIELRAPVKADRNKPVKKQICKLIDDLSMLFTPGLNGVVKASEDVVLMTFWNKNRSHRYKRSYFEHYTCLPFEGKLMKVPAAYDSVLKIEYGNYLKCSLAGGIHDYLYYTEIEGQIIKENNEYPFYYEFNSDDLKRKEKTGGKPVYALKKFTDIASRVQDLSAELLSQDKYDDVCSILASCQDAAAQNADIFVKAYGSDFAVSVLLNEYSAHTYEMYQAVNERDENRVQQAYSDIDAVISDLAYCVSELEKIKEAVFIVHKPDMWRFAENIWKSLNDNPEFIVTVIPVPYYYRDMNGNFTKEQYYTEGYPEYVELTRPEDYNIAARHPDMIFIQDPFDSVNYTTSIHPDFYSEKLAGETDRLIYIQSFETDEITRKSGKSIVSARHFIKTPGVVNADMVIVPSESMVSAYIDILTEYAGEDTRKIWEEKIKSPMEWRPSSSDETFVIPDEWSRIIMRVDGTRKKTMLYRISVSPVAEFGMKDVEKIKRSLQIFYERRDEIALILSPEDCIWDMLKEFPLVSEAFGKVMNDYRKEGWGIMMDDSMMETAIKICDAYYGDAGNMVNKVRRAGKPVMIEDVDV